VLYNGVSPYPDKQIVQRCKTLNWYCAFIGKVREYEKEGYSLKEAIRKAAL